MGFLKILVESPVQTFEVDIKFIFWCTSVLVLLLVLLLGLTRGLSLDVSLGLTLDLSLDQLRWVCC